MGVEFVTANVTEIQILEGAEKKLVTTEGEYVTKSIIFAMGARHRKLGVEGEDAFGGKGVSYCATCDGAFFRGKTVVVVGGGDVAVEDAIFLTRMCKKVYVVHRRDEFRAAKSLSERLKHSEKVEILWNHTVQKIQGEQSVTSVTVQDKNTGEDREIQVDGVFLAVGVMPNCEICQGVVDLDEDGYILAGEEGITSGAGMFAAGDIRKKQFRQIITAAADGANALNSAEKWLLSC
jgi:thioredoxin reductase (NADPH)